MKKVRYSVAASLDGYIAGPNGEADRIIMDPEIDYDTDPVTESEKTIASRRDAEAQRVSPCLRVSA